MCWLIFGFFFSLSRLFFLFFCCWFVRLFILRSSQPHLRLYWFIFVRRPLDDLYYVQKRKKKKMKRRKVFILFWLRFISWLCAVHIVRECPQFICVLSFSPVDSSEQIYISFASLRFGLWVPSKTSSQNVIIKFNIASITHSQLILVSSFIFFLVCITFWLFCFSLAICYDFANENQSFCMRENSCSSFHWEQSESVIYTEKLSQQKRPIILNRNTTKNDWLEFQTQSIFIDHQIIVLFSDNKVQEAPSKNETHFQSD